MAGDPFDYAAIRVVPRVEREEFVNVGVVLHAPTRRYLGCALGDAAVLARAVVLEPHVDLVAIAHQLAAFRAVCAGDPAGGPIAALSTGERFHWLVAPRSTIVQTSAVHVGTCDDPAVALHALYAQLVGDR